MGGLPREDCSHTSLKTSPKPWPGDSSTVSPVRNPPLRVGGVGRNRTSGNYARAHRKLKSWRVRVEKSSCVLGRDVAMDRVSSLAEKSLVGKFYYSRMSKQQLSDWILRHWKPIVGYCPRFIFLSNQWMVFHFLSEGDLLRVLGSPWIFGRGILMLKRWCLGFNPLSESFTKRYLWMLLPDFPIEFWSKKSSKPLLSL
jgi:hypothetical protein